MTKLARVCDSIVGRIESGEGAFLEEAPGLRAIDGLGFDHFGAAP